VRDFFGRFVEARSRRLEALEQFEAVAAGSAPTPMGCSPSERFDARDSDHALTTAQAVLGWVELLYHPSG
jgi:hypothetical protein